LRDTYPTNIFPDQIRKAIAICKKDIRIYYCKGPVIIFGLLLPLFLFLAFSIGRNLSLSFLVPGMLGMSVFFTSTSVVPVIAPWETRMKTFERLVSAPVTVATIIFGDILASAIFGLFISTVPVAVGLLAGTPIINFPIMLLSIVLSSFCFSSLGALLSAPPSDTPATVMMLSSLVKFPLVFISGIFIPLESMPLWGRFIAYLSPLTYFVDLVRHSTQGTGQIPLHLDLIILLAFTFSFFYVAVKLHQRSIPQRI